MKTKVTYSINPDSTFSKLQACDTISFRAKWASYLKYPVLKSDPFENQWLKAGEFYLGIRKVNNEDTLYSWIHLELANAGFILKSWATKQR